MRAWRIAARVHAALDGEGARLYGSRWTPRGRPAVFVSATLSLAALERFVHTDPDLEPDDLLSLAVDIPDKVAIDAVDLAKLPANWRTYPAPPALASIGEAWLDGARSAVLSVPSVIIPHEPNYVLNPLHEHFALVKVHPPETFSFDPRMWRAKRQEGRS